VRCCEGSARAGNISKAWQAGAKTGCGERTFVNMKYLKLELLQLRAERVRSRLQPERHVDGEEFF